MGEKFPKMSKKELPNGMLIVLFSRKPQKIIQIKLGLFCNFGQKYDECKFNPRRIWKFNSHSTKKNNPIKLAFDKLKKREKEKKKYYQVQIQTPN